MFQGSHSMPETTNFLDPAFYSGLPLYNLQRQCTENSTYSVSVPVMTFERQQGKDNLNLPRMISQIRMHFKW